MMLRPIRTVAPTTRIVSLEDAKLHLRVDADDENDLIAALVLAAESYVDGWSGVLGRCLINQTWEITFGNWPAGCMDLCFPDVSLVSVKYVDADNVEQTLSGSTYELLQGPRNSILRWLDTFTAPLVKDSEKAITVTITAGFGDAAEDIPQAIIQAAKLLIGAWYENREETVMAVSVGKLPESIAVTALLSPFRRVGL